MTRLLKTNTPRPLLPGPDQVSQTITTTQTTPQSNLKPTHSNHANPLGWLSLTLVAVGLVFIFMGDPYWLALPISLLGSLAGRICLQHGDKHHAWAHLGMNLGALNLFLWLLLIIIAPYGLGIPINELFVIPSNH